jgi:hypothetical protein
MRKSCEPPQQALIAKRSVFVFLSHSHAGNEIIDDTSGETTFGANLLRGAQPEKFGFTMAQKHFGGGLRRVLSVQRTDHHRS